MPIKRLFVFMSLLLFVFAFAKTNASGTLFEEQNGIVSMEAENHTRNNGYKLKNDKGGACGKGYMTDGSSMDYEIIFHKTGKWFVALHTWASNSDTDNGFHASFDGKSISGHGIYLEKKRTWKWGSVEQDCPGCQQISFQVNSAGKHTFTIRRREPDSRIDKIILHDGRLGTKGRDSNGMSGCEHPETISGGAVTVLDRHSQNKYSDNSLPISVHQGRLNVSNVQLYSAKGSMINHVFSHGVHLVHMKSGRAISAQPIVIIK